MCSHWLGQLIFATCKSVFSNLKHLKLKHRSVLTNTHVKIIVLGGNKGIRSYIPDLKKITLDKN